jgi:uncharacterized membrane protein
MTSLSDVQGRFSLDGQASPTRSQRGFEIEQPEQTDPANRDGQTNVGNNERLVSVAAGAIVALQGISRGSVPGLLCAAVGGMLIYRGATGKCPVYSALKVDTASRSNGRLPDEEIDEHGIHVEQAFLINRSADELYQYWRNFENLPSIMTHLKSVQVLDDRRSHWVAEAPRIAGGSVEWDAEITSDEPAQRIAWRSLPGSQVQTKGEIRFSKALGDRGTEVHVFMNYLPPAGKLGHWLATVFGESPRRQMRDDLRNFKRVMEVGEIPTTKGQPRGTCTGQGKREGE